MTRSSITAIVLTSVMLFCCGSGVAQEGRFAESGPRDDGAPPAPAAGREFTFERPGGLNRRGKPKPPRKIVCWLPKDCEYVRGVIVASDMIKALAVAPRFRRVAAEEGLGTMLGGIGKSGKDTFERLDSLFNEWAEASGHPEIRGAAILTGGLSASVIGARNVGYAEPDRVFGIIHVAGGNLHHGLVDERRTLSGVPFIAINGQFESCGPEGGIRPHLGQETQWYLMGDTMIERRKQDPDNLMSLVVVPIKGHTAWNKELAALFIRKAARYRLPKEKRDGSTPARCVRLKAEDGWLTDRNVKHPRHEPAAYADYKGDKTQAFWHFDEEVGGAPANFRAAVALGRMGKIAKSALPDLRKAARRGGIHEIDGMQSPKALAAIEAIEGDQ